MVLDWSADPAFQQFLKYALAEGLWCLFCHVPNGQSWELEYVYPGDPEGAASDVNILRAEGKEAALISGADSYEVLRPWSNCLAQWFYENRDSLTTSCQPSLAGDDGDAGERRAAGPDAGDGNVTVVVVEDEDNWPDELVSPPGPDGKVARDL